MNDDLLPTRPRVTDQDLVEAQRAIEDTRTRLQSIEKEQEEHAAEISRALAPAEAADADAARLTTHRGQLVEQLSSDPTLVKEIEDTDAEIAQLQRRARLFREAADKLPGRRTLAPERTAAAQRIARLIAQLAALEHQRACERLTDALAAAEPLVSSFHATNAELDTAWRAAFGGGAPQLDAPLVRFARLIGVWGRDLVFPQVELMLMRWPREAANLVRPVYAIVPPDAFRPELAPAEPVTTTEVTTED